MTGGIGKGRVLLWHYNPQIWCGAAAKLMYSGTLLKSLKKAYPSSKTFRCMEDNDPTGYKSSVAIKAKQAAKIEVIALPPRSPDLNPLDYAIWAEVNKRMRAQERKFKASQRETRAQFLKRLCRTAMNLPCEYVDRVMASLVKRCALCIKASGGHFPEGGLS